MVLLSRIHSKQGDSVKINEKHRYACINLQTYVCAYVMYIMCDCTSVYVRVRVCLSVH